MSKECEEKVAQLVQHYVLANFSQVTIDLLAVKCMMGEFNISAGKNGVLNQFQ